MGNKNRKRKKINSVDACNDLEPEQMGQELKVAAPGFSSGLVSGNHSSQEVEDGAIYSAH